MARIASPLGRILIALLFIIFGIHKITGYAGTQAYMEAHGLPGTLLPLVILLEVGGGIAIIVGWFTRTVALIFALFCIATAVIFHGDLGNQVQMIMFLKDIALAGGFLFLVANGPGALSIGRN
jgi:putative oxidoreductase